MRDPQWAQGNPPHQLPIYAASSFVFDDLESGIAIFDGQQAGNIYSRFGNPTVDAVAAKIARLEGMGMDAPTHGLLTASGMAAISLLALGLLRPGEGERRVLYRSDYYKAFVDSVRDQGPSVAPITDAVRSDALSHLAVLAIQSGETVVWDPQRYRIQSPSALNQHLSRPVRGPWIQS